MDATELAKLMLEWQEKQVELQELEETIKDAVMKMEQTQVVGRAKATFYNPRKTYDYEKAARDAGVSQMQIETYSSTEIVTKTDWRGLCNTEGIEEIPYTETPARVALKLV